MNQHIASTASVGENTILGHNIVIMDNVEIGEDCVLGCNVVIHDNVKIGSGCRIDDNTIIGKKPMFSPRSIFKDQNNWSPTIIGDNCLIGANVIIYIQCEIGNNNLIADMATIRENVKIQEYNIVGRGVAIENYCTIGNRNKLETNVYLTAYSTVEDYCFVAPCVATSNDNYAGRDKERFKHFKGITMKRGARIGVGSIVLPGKTLNKDCLVAGASLVSKDVPEKEIWIGSPAKYSKPVPDSQLLDNNQDKKE
ncbi:MAG TPA: DapH/DapD/GlmU-related protein [Candidatus Cloacimonadota bacterium]|jgi:acetyltransferase-like isoleucine patch superfamily enzyme|nr:DapH/DapD/GlmU-related protein [Candidatus Cloacimonadales bacterium]HPY95830.1 DapH/DapD/GlmU-related protein [Candidatus Cloacimonadota bacterium]HQB40532.1 DapH/DapD/GlmU-related protein [Candidatus Cloacimonadota bacterium]